MSHSMYYQQPIPGQPLYADNYMADPMNQEIQSIIKRIGYVVDILSRFLMIYKSQMDTDPSGGAEVNLYWSVPPLHEINFKKCYWNNMPNEIDNPRRFLKTAQHASDYFVMCNRMVRMCHKEWNDYIVMAPTNQQLIARQFAYSIAQFVARYIAYMLYLREVNQPFVLYSTQIAPIRKRIELLLAAPFYSQLFNTLLHYAGLQQQTVTVATRFATNDRSAKSKTIKIRV